jgi:integrase
MTIKNKQTRIQVAGPHPVYIQKRGSRWHIDFSIQAKQYRFSLKEKQEGKARIKAKKISNEVHEGTYGQVSEDSELAPLLEQYLDFYKVKNKPRSYRTAEKTLAKTIRDLKIESLADIQPGTFEAKMVDMIKEGRAARTANTYLVYMKGFLNWAVDREFIKKNPLAKLKNIRGDKKKTRRAMTDKEVKTLLKVSGETADLWHVFLHTGMRKNEFISLKVSDIDIKKRLISISEAVAKNRTHRKIGIHKEILPIFRKAIKGQSKSDPVFRNNEERWNESTLLWHFIKNKKAAKLKKPEQIDIHSLRVTFCTNLARNGVHPKTAMELMGHKTLDMTMNIYTLVDTKDTMQAIDKLPSLK